MLRKIQYTGNASYIITLPKDWVIENNLKEKNYVRIEYSKSKVIIRPVKIEHAKIINAKELELLKKEVIAAYIHGFERILIKGDRLKKKDLEEIIIFCNSYLKGVDIRRKNKDLLIESLIDYDNIDVIALLDDFFKDIIDIKSLLKHSRKIDDSYIDKEALFLKKICMENIEVPKLENINEKTLVNIYAVVAILENIADSIIELQRLKNNRHMHYLLNYFQNIYYAYLHKDLTELSNIAEALRKRKHRIKLELRDLARLEIDLAEELIDLISSLQPTPQ